MTDTLEVKRAAWLEAVQRAEHFARSDAEAASKMREAINTRENFIDRMAGGEEGIHRADYTQACQVVRDREVASKLASALALGARRRADVAQIEFLNEKTKHLDARKVEAEERVFAKATKLDRSVAQARDDAEDLASAERDLAAIGAEKSNFNFEVEALAKGGGGQRVNEALAAVHPGHWPKARFGHNDPGAHQLPSLKVELVAHDKVIGKSAQEFVIAHGITPPAPLAEADKAA